MNRADRPCGSDVMLMSVVKNDGGKGTAPSLDRAAKKKIIKHHLMKRLFLQVCKQWLWPLIPQREEKVGGPFVFFFVVFSLKFPA